MLIVTATDLPRLMDCNGSRLMGGGIPPINPNDTVRDEGNAADWLVQQIYTGAFTAEELIDRKAPNGTYITSEMVEFLEEYLKGKGVIELDTSYAGNGGLGRPWQVNGRADRVNYIRETATVKIDDLKYGWRIVEPEMNWTMISHVIGFMAQNPSYPVERAELTIYQPRPHHYFGRVRTWTIDKNKIAELYAQLNATLSDPSDLLRTGPNCYGCPALANCPAAHKAQYNAIEASEMAFNDELNNGELSYHIDLVKRAIAVLEQKEKAYSELAMHKLRKGEILDNYSLENELTNRQWKENITAEVVQLMTGKDLTKKQLISPAQAEKAGLSSETVNALTTRQNKGVKLVRVDANSKAKKMFGAK